MKEAIMHFLHTTGFYNLTLGRVVMIFISLVLLYLAIKKGFEPLLLIPIAFGMLLANLPMSNVMLHPEYALYPEHIAAANHIEGNVLDIVINEGGEFSRAILQNKTVGGLLYYLFQGDHLGIFPPLIFLGVGSMTDFGPLIANPKSLLLGAAAQFGIYATFAGAIFLGFTVQEASAIGVIGGADGPTAIYTASILAPEKLGAIAVAAYSYMALVPVIQPPIMRLLTTKQERQIKMKQLRNVSKLEKILFPIVVTILVALFVPAATALVGMLMLGNLFKECGVTQRLTDTAQNALMNIVTILLGVTVGATASAEYFLQVETLKIISLGVIAVGFGTAAGVLLAKLLNKITKQPLNPLIGSAGVSAVPMAARVSQKEGQLADPSNFLLMHAMGPNVAGVIGSAVSAGVLISLFAK